MSRRHPESDKPCSIVTCDAPSRTRTWCNKHYQYWHHHGVPEKPVVSVLDRIMARVDKNGPVPGHRPDLGPCWIWPGAKVKGYGYVNAKGLTGSRLVHRIVFESLSSPIPAGLDLDHLCRVTACCNPHHLEPVTHRENLHRGVGLPAIIASRKDITHCSNGHEYTPDNTYVNPGTGYRRCKECHRAWARTYQQQRRAAA